MSKTSRKKRSAERMKRKRAVKEARRSMYASLAGTSKKRKRQVSKAQTASAEKGSHRMSNCGNVGCVRCFPQFRALSHQELAAIAA
jgi:hypothetical protein